MACRAPTGGCRTVLAASLGIGTPDTDDVFAFNATSTAETISEGLDLGGLTYLVTGATGGLGGEVCRVFALRGARVVLACRSLEKGESVAEKIRGEIVGASLVVLGGLDLGSAVKTKTFAETFCALALPLNGIVCCAGVVCEPFGLTCDGRETHFGVNHLGHFLLVDMLLDECVNTAAASGAQGRIVLVSSGAHHFTYRVRRGVTRPSRGFDWTNLDSPIGYDDGAAYAQSKVRAGPFPNYRRLVFPYSSCEGRITSADWGARSYRLLHTSQVDCLPIHSTCTLKTDTFLPQSSSRTCCTRRSWTNASSRAASTSPRSRWILGPWPVSYGTS